MPAAAKRSIVDHVMSARRGRLAARRRRRFDTAHRASRRLSTGALVGHRRSDPYVACMCGKPPKGRPSEAAVVE
jgi:hypothetical protein